MDLEEVQIVLQIIQQVEIQLIIGPTPHHQVLVIQQVQITILQEIIRLNLRIIDLLQTPILQDLIPLALLHQDLVVIHPAEVAHHQAEVVQEDNSKRFQTNTITL